MIRMTEDLDRRHLEVDHQASPLRLGERDAVERLPTERVLNPLHASSQMEPLTA